MHIIAHFLFPYSQSSGNFCKKFLTRVVNNIFITHTHAINTHRRVCGGYNSINFLKDIIHYIAADLRFGCAYMVVASVERQSLHWY